MSNKFFLFLSILLMLSCNNDLVINDAKTPIDIKENEVPKITPIRIANDSATIKILHFNLYGENDFNIELKEKERTSVFDISKYSIKDSVTLKEILDSLETDNIEDVFIKDVNYKGIRANSLYFYSVMKNDKNNKSIGVQFAVFYRDTKRYKSGTVFAWLVKSELEKEQYKNN